MLARSIGGRMSDVGEKGCPQDPGGAAWRGLALLPMKSFLPQHFVLRKAVASGENLAVSVTCGNLACNLEACAHISGRPSLSNP